MSGLRGLVGNKEGEGNFGVDYVVDYKIPPKERDEAEAGFIQLIEALTRVGLATEVRHGSKASLLVFIRLASPGLLARQIYASRLQDWLHGVRTAGPGDDVAEAMDREPVTEAERLRLVYQVITNPKNEGGAGITPKQGRWKHVASLFPLHNHAFNKAWLQKWSQQYVLDQGDLDAIRDKFGEDVAFYFAFLKDYYRFLVFPSAAGLGAWLLLGQFSPLYAIASCLWSVVFFEYWKQRQVDLAVSWGVRGVSKIQNLRPEFRLDFGAEEDPITGQPIYPPLKRLGTQLLQIPFAIACVIALGGLVITCNSLEIFINEVYAGPAKEYLTFLPTILLSVFTPVFSSLLMRAAKFLTDRENYETMDAYNAALVQKQFVLNFLTSYMALSFTSFVYIPFGHILHPFLEFWGSTAQTITLGAVPLPVQHFEANPDRISNQMFYTTVTAQIINALTEVVVPYLTHKASAKAQEMQSKGTEQVKDHPEEAEFLRRVRDEAQLDVYNVTDDYREMVMQFGYLSLFSVSWPLTSLCFLINNWVEQRSDALKIAISSRRPIPWRADSIGPWLTAIGFLSWLGSISSAAIVLLCQGTASQLTGWGFLATIMFAEHLYFSAQFLVRYVMSKVESPGMQQERRERFQMKKRLMEETLGKQAAEKNPIPAIEVGEKITLKALEDEAREASINGQAPSPEEKFWQRQRGMQETIFVGKKLIEESLA
ncbi:Uncharacterized protein ESCO_003221 [Escovopsis weberi]|uniref:Uncharacterized protein n=1 Tax=Escovopsis weberi TaxID=150374 RepID=A0A0M9VSY4_ESCWE|nr:Uncharacterized protein ESCO_003221 [Escovopsis weberi]